MAICYINVQSISRSARRSATAAAAYRAGCRIVDERTGAVHDYTRKAGVVHSEVMLPEHAPERWLDRSTLWNEVEQIERRADASLARETVVAVPHEIPADRRIAWGRDLVREMCTSRGMVADWSMHDPGGDGHNVHMHVLCPRRSCDANGFRPKSVNVYTVRNADGDEREATGAEFKLLKAEGWEKVYTYKLDGLPVELTRSQAEDKGLDPTKDRLGRNPVQHARYLNDWDKPELVQEWRKEYADAANRELERLGLDERIDHRSYAEQGINKQGMVHEGPKVTAMEQRAEEQAEREGRPYEPVTDIRRENIEITERNARTELRERIMARLETVQATVQRIRDAAQQLIERWRDGRDLDQQPAEPTPEQAVKAYEQAVKAERRADARLTDANRRDPDQGDERCGLERCWKDMVKADLGQAKTVLDQSETKLDKAQDRLHDLERHSIINRSKIPDARAEVAKAEDERDQAKEQVAKLTASYQEAKLDYAKALVDTQPAHDKWQAEVAKAQAKLEQAKELTADRLVEVNKALDRMPPAEALKALEDRWISEVRACTSDDLCISSDVIERQAERAAVEIADPAQRYAALNGAAERLDRAGSHLAASRVSDMATAAYRQIPEPQRQQADRTASAMVDRLDQRFDAAMARAPEPVVNQPAPSLDLRVR